MIYHPGRIRCLPVQERALGTRRFVRWPQVVAEYRTLLPWWEDFHQRRYAAHSHGRGMGRRRRSEAGTAFRQRKR